MMKLIFSFLQKTPGIERIICKELYSNITFVMCHRSFFINIVDETISCKTWVDSPCNNYINLIEINSHSTNGIISDEQTEEIITKIITDVKIFLLSEIIET